MNRKYTSLCNPLALCAWVRVPVAKAYSQGLAVRKQHPTQRRNAAPHHRALPTPVPQVTPIKVVAASRGAAQQLNLTLNIQR